MSSVEPSPTQEHVGIAQPLTPGPWEVGQHPALPNGWIIRPVLFGSRVSVLPEHEGGHVVIRNEADARLMAAALELRERLQAIIDWADIALRNPQGFNSHGVRNLDGPVFDAAREVLATLPDGSASDRVTEDAEPSTGRLGHINPPSNLSGEAG
jgi:hypothetical protein